MKQQASMFLLLSCMVILHCNGGEVLQTIGKEDQCPPWFSYDHLTKECKCFQSPSTDNIVRCAKERALLRSGYCMTYDTGGGGVSVSPCNDYRADDRNTTKDNYIILPENITELNEYMCAPLNKRGLACSECTEGFGRAVLSPVFACSNCTNAWYGIPLYLFMEFVPITVFYFLVLLFQIDMTSAPMLAYVFYSQLAVSTLLRVQTNTFQASYTSSFLNILLTFYGFWNLDFFRYIIPPFCISPELQPIHIVSLRYISAFYPLCLIVISWICIKLHSHDVRPIIWLWSKLKKGLSKSVGLASNSMINMFATFFLLSYAKLLFTSFTILSYGITFNLNNGTLTSTIHVESDPGVTFFSTEHLPFVIIAITIFLIAIMPLTLLLAFYPFRIIRSSLIRIFCCTHHSIVSLNIFVEKYYSCYRDGLDGGRDLRSLASLYFFLRLVINFIFIDQIPLSASYTLAAILYGGCSILIAILQPYKKSYMNTIDSLILANMALITILLDKYSGQDNSNVFGTIYLVIGSILTTLPMLGMIGFVTYKIIKKCLGKKTLPCTKRALCCLRSEGIADVQVDQQRNSDDLELPDRFVHPDEYSTKSNSYGTHTTDLPT